MNQTKSILDKIVALILTMTMVFVLTACGNNQSQGNEQKSRRESETTESATGESVSEDTTGKVLVAYFSHTGTTEGVAQTIAQLTGADLAEIQRAEEYKDLYEEAEKEIQDGEHPEITVSVDDISSYDTIFIGYPIWWKEAPAMIATFLAENNFAGKTIIPFCTSSSDSIDNSLHIFNELCPDAQIAEALTANNTDDIEPWIESLGLLAE